MSKYQAQKFTYLRHSYGEKLVGGYQRDADSQTSTQFQELNLEQLRNSGNFTKSVNTDHVNSQPPGVDLRSYLSPVVDHSTTASCTVDTIVAAAAYLVQRHQQQEVSFSSWFLYYNARELRGAVGKDVVTAEIEGAAEIEVVTEQFDRLTVRPSRSEEFGEEILNKNAGEDGGVSFVQTMKALQNQGLCSTDFWQDYPATVNISPPETAYQNIFPFPWELPQKITPDLDCLKQVLAWGYPIALGLAIFESLGEVAEDGVVAFPEVDREDYLGSHALLVVGYSDIDEVVIARNTWGSNWGDRGYCYLPYEYFRQPDLLGNAWILCQHQDLPTSQDHWLNGDSIFYQDEFLDELDLDLADNLSSELPSDTAIDILESLEEDHDYLSASDLSDLDLI